MGAWTSAAAIRCDGLALAASVVDVILTDIYAGKATFGAAAPTLNIGGTNAAPTGIYLPVCPPTDGLNTVYALSHENCVADGPEWAITYTAP